MTQEEKQLLLKDLCGRLPYDVLYAEIVWEDGPAYEVSFINTGVISDLICDEIKSIKPYLRPMSSMTKEETKYKLSNFFKIIDTKTEGVGYIPTLNSISAIKYIDWLNKNHFDYRGLIEKGLALEVKEGMYK